MKVQSDTLSGIQTFRGLGYVEIDRILVPVCGQEMVDCGNNSECRWIPDQITRLRNPKPTIRGAVRGLFGLKGKGSTPIADSYFRTADGRKLLTVGEIEGIPLGIVDLVFSGGGGIQLIQMMGPFEMRYPGGLIASGALSAGAGPVAWPYAGSYFDTLDATTGEFPTEIFLR